MFWENSASVVCRGASAQYFIDNPEYINRCSTLYKVNEWWGDEPEYFVENKHKLVHYINKDTPGHRKFLAKPFDKKLYNVALDVINTKDCGLKVIAQASIAHKTLYIAGLDFWEAFYWSATDTRRDASRTTMARYHRQEEKIDLLIKYMIVCSDTKFYFFTYSKNFLNKLDSMKPSRRPNNVIIELLK